LVHSGPWSQYSLTYICISVPLFPSLAYSFTMNMEAAYYSEIMVKIYQTTCCHIPKDNNLHSHCCKNLISHSAIIITKHTYMHACTYISIHFVVVIGMKYILCQRNY
jgi:hypothetical protein